MNVLLLESTPNPERVVYLASKQCYSAGFVGEFNHSEELYAPLIRKVINMGHTSVLEHVSFTFAIEGISRACSHQLVRFRVASFSQQSQRYVEAKEPKYIVPDSIVEKGFELPFRDLIENVIFKAYKEFVETGIPAEDARFVLPNATETKIVVTMNARELLHAFELRCCFHSQWEIRNLFNEMLKIVKEKAPVIFEKAGATCETKGVCYEGERCCGKVENFRKYI